MVAEGVVYVVDDDPAMRKSLIRLIQQVNLRVQAFSTAAHFLADYDAGKPACLILDVRLPGMSGGLVGTDQDRHCWLTPEGVEWLKGAET